MMGLMAACGWVGGSMVGSLIPKAYLYDMAVYVHIHLSHRIATRTENTRKICIIIEIHNTLISAVFTFAQINYDDILCADVKRGTPIDARGWNEREYFIYRISCGMFIKAAGTRRGWMDGWKPAR